MKSEQQLLRDIEMTTNTLNSNPNSAPALFKRATARIVLDGINNNHDHSSEIELDLKAAIKLDGQNTQYLSTLMEYNCKTQNVSDAIGIAIDLHALIQNSPEGVIEMSSKQTLARVLEMQEIIQLTQENPAIEAVVTNIMNFLAPHIIELEKHTEKLNDHEHRIEEVTTTLKAHESRLSNDEVEIHNQQIISSEMSEKLQTFINKVENQLLSLPSTEEFSQLKEDFTKQKDLITKALSNKSIKLDLEIGELKSKITEIDPTLMKYVKGIYEVIENCMLAIKLRDSEKFELVYKTGKVTDIIDAVAEIAGPATKLIPIVGDIAQGGVSIAKGAATKREQSRFKDKMDNIDKMLSSLDPDYSHKEISQTIHKEVYEHKDELLSKINIGKILGPALYKHYELLKDERHDLKVATKQAFDSSNTYDIPTTVGAADGRLFLKMLSKNSETKKEFLETFREFFESMPKEINQQLNDNKLKPEALLSHVDCKSNKTQSEGIGKAAKFAKAFKKLLPHKSDHNQKDVCSDSIKNILTQHTKDNDDVPELVNDNSDGQVSADIDSGVVVTGDIL